MGGNYIRESVLVAFDPHVFFGRNGGRRRVGCNTRRLESTLRIARSYQHDHVELSGGGAAKLFYPIPLQSAGRSNHADSSDWTGRTHRAVGQVYSRDAAVHSS